jgi:hypothetical protein
LYLKEKSDKPVDEQTYAMGVSEAEAYLREQLDFGTSQIDRFSLDTETRSGQVLNTLNIRLIAPSMQVLNQELPMAKVFPIIHIMDQDKLFHVNVSWLEIVSPEGEVWLDYIFDSDLQMESWWMVEGISED